MRRVACWLALVTVTANTSCSLIRRGRGKAQTPVLTAPQTKPPVPVENPSVPPPPKVEQAQAPKIGPPVNTEITAKPPPRPKPVRRPVRKPAPVKAQAPAPESPPMIATQEPPVLSPVLSTAQQDSFNRAIDGAVQQAENALASVAAKPLNPTQQANANRARSFVAQAQQTRSTDLVTAKTLADRAVVLALSIAEELR